MSGRCRTCDQYLWSWDRDDHRCPPLWSIWCPESHGDEELEARGVSEEDAAETWLKGQCEDAADWDEREVVVCVAELGKPPGEGKWIRVQLEYAPEFTSDWTEPDDDDLKALGLTWEASQ